MILTQVVGFDYAQAVRELSHRMSYEQIARAIGYKSKGSIHMILDGRTPSHVKGEALWALYCETFLRKPPHSAAQAKGTSKETKLSV